MSRPSPNFATGLLDAFVAPASLFRALPDRRWGWAAFALVALALAVSMFVFFQPMSPEWIVEQQLLQMGDRISEQDIERARPQMLSMAPHTAAFTAIGGVLMTGLLVLLVGSLYMLLARVATGGPRRGWSAWIRFAAWIQLPQLAYALGLILIVLLASTPDLPMGQMGYASLNNLVLDLPPGHRWYNFALNVNLFTLWSLVLAAIGIRTWTGAGWGRSLLVAAAPWLLVYGIWAAFT